VAGHKFLEGVAHLGIGLAVNLAIVFVGSMVCHGNLVRLRPGARNLTEFYLWMSLGGVLGGIFTGLLAPVIFESLLEYPLLLLLVLAVSSAATSISIDAWKRAGRTIGGFMIPIVGVFAVLLAIGYANPETLAVLFFVMVLGAAVVLVRYTGAVIPVGAAAVIAVYVGMHAVQDTETSRSFFGVFQVSESEDGRFRSLKHGTTIHGVQRIRNADGSPTSGRPEPLSYYHDRAPMAMTIAATRVKLGRPISIGVIGLGTGSLACHAQPGDHWTFYEIDPEVVALARDNRYFAFLHDCAPDAPIIIGDARLTIEKAPQKSYDILIVDAFSSDAIPVHLITREAINIYRSKLNNGGMLVFHISNRFLDLKSVLSSIAVTENMAMLHRRSTVTKADRDEFLFSSRVAVLAENADSFGPMKDDQDWRHETPVPSITPWTDDYSNVFSALMRKLAQLIG
jgi:spermidine synthase